MKIKSIIIPIATIAFAALFIGGIYEANYVEALTASANQDSYANVPVVTDFLVNTSIDGNNIVDASSIVPVHLFNN